MTVPTAQEFKEAAAQLSVVVERYTELMSRVDNGADAARLVRHALLLAADAMQRQQSLPEIVATLNAAAIPDQRGDDWTEASLVRSVQAAREAVDAAVRLDLDAGVKLTGPLVSIPEPRKRHDQT